MDFVTFLSQLLALLGELLQAWPLAVASVVFIPALVNGLKWLLPKLGIDFDGRSATIVFGINFVLFAIYTVLRIADVDTTGLDSILTNVAAIITALLGLVSGALGRSVYEFSKARNIPVLGYSFADSKQ